MAGGTFNVARSIWDHPEFARSEFSEREAFLWLVSEAAWKPCRVRAGRVVVDVERGQLCHSVRFMADAWGWSKSRVDRFLGRLKNRDMIGTDSGTGQLVITICNYDKFQSENEYSGTRAGRDPGHDRDTSGTEKNKVKKVNKEEDSANALSARAKPLSILAEVLGDELAREVVEHRRRIQRPLGDRAAKKLAAEFERCANKGHAVDVMLASGWRGFEYDWYANKLKASPAPVQSAADRPIPEPIPERKPLTDAEREERRRIAQEAQAAIGYRVSMHKMPI